MALKNDVMNEYFEKMEEKKDLELSNKGGSKVRLFDEPDAGLEKEQKNRENDPGTNSSAKANTKLETGRVQKRVQKRVHDLHKSGFLASSGFRRKALMTIYEYCCASRSLQTPRLSIENIAKGCNGLVNTVKKTLQRLEKEGFIKRVGYKVGRSGWTVYALDKRACQEIGVQLDVAKSV